MANNEKDLKFMEILNGYDEAGPVPNGGFKDSDLVGEKRHKKIIALENIVKKVESKINDFVIANHLNIPNIKIIATGTTEIKADKIITGFASAAEKMTKGGASQIEVPLNINVNKLLRLPALEVYSLLYGTVYNSVVSKTFDKNHGKGDDYVFGKEITENTLEEYKQNNSFDEKTESKGIISEFLKWLFSKFFKSGEFDNSKISVATADSIINSVDTGSLKNNLEPFFATDGLNFEKLATEKGQSINEIFAARIQKLGMNADLGLEGDGKDPSKAPGYMQQATELLAYNTKDDFERMKVGLENGNANGLVMFCENYVNTFLSSNGILMDKVEITYEERGGLGTYTDYAGSKKDNININVSKIMEMGNISELVVTLSHELTHAVDSIKNKEKNITSDGYGLVNDMEEDISFASNENPEVYSYVKKLNEICYYINPNERHARTGELSALEYMKNVASDGCTKRCIIDSVNRYNRTQQKTINYMEMVNGDGINEIINEYESIKSSIVNKSTYKLIEERLSYIKKLKDLDLLNINEEEKAKEIASRIAREATAIKNVEEQQEGQQYGA